MKENIKWFSDGFKSEFIYQLPTFKKLLYLALIVCLFSCVKEGQQKPVTQTTVTYWRCIHAVNKATHKREYVGCCINGPTIDIYLAAKLKNYYTDPTEYNITTDSSACKNF